MPITLEELATDIRSILQADDTAAGKQAVIEVLSRALLDKDFVATNLKTRAPGAPVRQVLYEDPDLGFCICGHVHDGPAHGEPHDHGDSWAIYGQAEGVTEMTDWRMVDPGSASEPMLVVPERTYRLEPGQAKFYDVGDVHSPKRDGPVKLLRVEGRNLDRVTRSNIRAK